MAGRDRESLIRYFHHALDADGIYRPCEPTTTRLDSANWRLNVPMTRQTQQTGVRLLSHVNFVNLAEW